MLHDDTMTWWLVKRLFQSSPSHKFELHVTVDTVSSTVEVRKYRFVQRFSSFETLLALSFCHVFLGGLETPERRRPADKEACAFSGTLPEAPYGKRLLTQRQG